MSQNIGFQISDMQIHQFEFDNEIEPEKGIKMELGVRFGSDPEKKAIGCKLRIQFLGKVKPVLELTFSCGFLIEPSEWETHVDKDRELLNLPLEFLRHIAALTYTTSRGVLFAKSERTKFANLVLPVVNFVEFITEAPQIQLYSKGYES